MKEERDAPFDFRTIRDPLNELIVATRNLLEKQWPARYEGLKDCQMVLMQYYGLAVTHFRTVTFICADVKDGAVRDPLLVLSSPPINRSILEIIFSVLYLLEDPPEHTRLYYRAAWRAEQESLIRHQKHYLEKYGGKGKPLMDAYIANRTELLAKMEPGSQITPEEKADLNMIARWPKLRQLRVRLKDSAQTLSYLNYLDDWFYFALSTHSHGEPMGVGEMGLHFLGMGEMMAISGEDRDAVEARLDVKIVEFRTTQVWIAITLLMSLISEIKAHFDYDILTNRLLYVWGMIRAYSEISEEVYEERYKSLLTP